MKIYRTVSCQYLKSDNRKENASKKIELN